VEPVPRSPESHLPVTRSQSLASELLDVIVLATRTVRRELRRARPPIETTQWVLLRRIKDGSFTMSELARLQGSSLSTMSKSVTMLVKRGWVERVAHEADRRQARVQLTARGRRTLKDYRERFELALAEQLSELAPAEREQMMEGLTKLATVLRAGDR